MVKINLAKIKRKFAEVTTTLENPATCNNYSVSTGVSNPLPTFTLLSVAAYYCRVVLSTLIALYPADG